MDCIYASWAIQATRAITIGPWVLAANMVAIGGAVGGLGCANPPVKTQQGGLP